MKSLIVFLMVLPVIGLAQVREPAGSYTKRPNSSPLGLPATGKIDTSWIPPVSSSGGFQGWYQSGGSFVGDSLRFIQGANITLTESGRTLTIAGGAGGSGLSGWYVNGSSLVTDTLRFLRPTSMVFIQSGRTIAIYPDTSAGKIATKSDLGAYLPLHATADSSVASYWASNIRGNYLKASDSAGMASRAFVVALGTADTTGLGARSYVVALATADTTTERAYSNLLYLGLHATADSAKASYWATAVRGGYLTPTDSNSFHNQFTLKAPLVSPSFTTPTLGAALATSIAFGGVALDSSLTLGTGGFHARFGRVDSSITVGSDLILKKGIQKSWKSAGLTVFSGTNARVAQYIPGATSTDVYVVTPMSPNGTTAPVLANVCFWLAKTDSLIIIRGTGGLTGMTVGWMRQQ